MPHNVTSVKWGSGGPCTVGSQVVTGEIKCILGNGHMGPPL